MGIALALATFGEFGGDLLVGNFSYMDSIINAFDPTTGAFEGAIQIDPGIGNTSGGLWALDFGIGGGVNNGDPNTLISPMALTARGTACSLPSRSRSRAHWVSLLLACWASVYRVGGVALPPESGTVQPTAACDTIPAAAPERRAEPTKAEPKPKAKFPPKANTRSPQAHAAETAPPQTKR